MLLVNCVAAAADPAVAETMTSCCEASVAVADWHVADLARQSNDAGVRVAMAVRAPQALAACLVSVVVAAPVYRYGSLAAASATVDSVRSAELLQCDPLEFAESYGVMCRHQAPE